MIAVARKPVAKCVSVVVIHADVYFMLRRYSYDRFWLAGWLVGWSAVRASGPMDIPPLADSRSYFHFFRKRAAYALIFILSAANPLRGARDFSVSVFAAFFLVPLGIFHASAKSRRARRVNARACRSVRYRTTHCLLNFTIYRICNYIKRFTRPHIRARTHIGARDTRRDRDTFDYGLRNGTYAVRLNRAERY